VDAIAPTSRGLYLLHFEPRYQHAQHYLGYAANIARRLAEHKAGRACSSPLIRAALSAGCTVALARIWPEGTRSLERQLKRQGGLSRHCPTCRESGAYHH
jgi:hypothetical protein